METKNVKAFGTESAEAPLKTLDIKRRGVLAHDVEIEILYCGICHSDLHSVRNEWYGTIYPIVPGHEIVGRVTKVGDHVKNFKVGDLAGVGCMVDSCRECENCKKDLEQYCDSGMILTFNSPDAHLGGQTFGGYSESIVVDENYVLHISDKLDLAGVAPLLCAGITTYSPLKHWNVGPGQKVGVVGIGGLGHMGIKLAKAMGAHVVVFTTSLSKSEDAKRLGADEVVLSTDLEQMAKFSKSLNFILDCVSAAHDIDAYLNLLKVDGTLTLVGAPMEPLPVTSFSLLLGRRSFAGSAIGGIAETQEMLDFCAEHNITADIELIGVNDVNDAYERLLKGDIKYRFVIDMASLKN
ncbi:NAD(P)-dependent alcohol dehydrogenase [Flavobacterium sp. CF136]|uniref:NAD(P)-dependent alcohol dehydrogenase n=1 Tax=Flavobacterium sp. (strain CF136) TaxID=1144313 RepID=UPI000271AFE6|nr:NAD(P)-dependent alcohol dehydrogenase [Flavobacterium sp. CF136]EJL67135.1 Zn-dependent alcohol dehydrogenase [Flavobacterium sp. CF136]